MAWEKVDKRTIARLKEQKAFEDRVAKGLAFWQDSFKNPFVRLVIHRIILDTMRHSDTYQMLIDLNEGAFIGEASRAAMAAEVAAHIKEESRMLEQAKRIGQSIKEKRFKRILTQIIEDERKHHETLQDLSDMLRKEAAEWSRYLYKMYTDFL